MCTNCKCKLRDIEDCVVSIVETEITVAEIDNIKHEENLEKSTKIENKINEGPEEFNEGETEDITKNDEVGTY